MAEVDDLTMTEVILPRGRDKSAGAAIGPIAPSGFVSYVDIKVIWALNADRTGVSCGADVGLFSGLLLSLNVRERLFWLEDVRLSVLRWRPQLVSQGVFSCAADTLS